MTLSLPGNEVEASFCFLPRWTIRQLVVQVGRNYYYFKASHTRNPLMISWATDVKVSFVQNKYATTMNASSTPLEFQGAQLSSRFESGNGRKRAIFDIYEENSMVEDDCFKQGEKKKRLNIEQVRTLERNFELGSRLEPKRKLKLAKALGLQPRQIAIWFQNRRARCRTKQSEKDFDVLIQYYEAFKFFYHKLQEENKILQDEVRAQFIFSQNILGNVE
eukprot:Gb_39722 [translate_table: standard]